jgi:hypothetical protein
LKWQSEEIIIPNSYIHTISAIFLSVFILYISQYYFNDKKELLISEILAIQHPIKFACF